MFIVITIKILTILIHLRALRALYREPVIWWFSRAWYAQRAERRAVAAHKRKWDWLESPDGQRHTIETVRGRGT